MESIRPKKIRGDLAGILRGDDLLVNLLWGEQTGLWYACVLVIFYVTEFGVLCSCGIFVILGEAR